MASSDSTGFHVNGWRFHQFSSSGGVLQGSSGCQLELDDGVTATLSTGATFNINGTMNVNKGALEIESSGQLTLKTGNMVIDTSGQIQHQNYQILSTTGGTITNNGLTVITCTSSEASYDLAAPVNGSRKTIMFGGEVSSSSLISIVSSSGRADIGTGAAGGTSGDRTISSSSNAHRVATNGPLKIELQATGTGHWRLLSTPFMPSHTTAASVVAFALTTN